MTKKNVHIGLEVHVTLNTNSKLFSSSAQLSNSAANSCVSHYDLAMPGTLPVLNKKALEKALLFALACNAEIQDTLYFQRKHYSYPDLAKGYQITQHDTPLMRNGQLPYIDENGKLINISISSAHLEEDAAKLQHDPTNNKVNIDYNRAGAALLEIVTPPCFHDAAAVIAWIKSLKQLLIDLNISKARMHAGELRCDVNISLGIAGSKTGRQHTEIKNLNSLQAIKRAIAAEITRQQQIEKNDATLATHTRHYNSSTGNTEFARHKQSNADYCYMAEPDLPISAMPLELLPKLREQLITAHWQLQLQLQQDYQLTTAQAAWLSRHRQLMPVFIDCCQLLEKPSTTNLAITYIMNHLQTLLDEQQIELENTYINAAKLATLINAIADKQLSVQHGRKILSELMVKDVNIAQLMTRKSLTPEQNTGKLELLIDAAIQAAPHLVQDYAQGRTAVINRLMQHIMQAANNNINPAPAYARLKEKLEQQTEQQHD